MSVEEQIYNRWINHLFEIEAMIEIGWSPGLDDLTPDEWKGLMVIKQERNRAVMKRIKEGRK